MLDLPNVGLQALLNKGLTSALQRAFGEGAKTAAEQSGKLIADAGVNVSGELGRQVIDMAFLEGGVKSDSLWAAVTKSIAKSLSTLPKGV